MIKTIWTMNDQNVFKNIIDYLVGIIYLFKYYLYNYKQSYLDIIWPGKVKIKWSKWYKRLQSLSKKLIHKILYFFLIVTVIALLGVFKIMFINTVRIILKLKIWIKNIRKRTKRKKKLEFKSIWRCYPRCFWKKRLSIWCMYGNSLNLNKILSYLKALAKYVYTEEYTE